MSGLQQIPEHVQWMGMLVVNLQSLEFALRAFLYNDEKGWENDDGPDFLDDLREGQELEENAFTNFDTLGKLIDKYNNRIRSRSSDLEVDTDIARIRDALAHGRIASRSPSPNQPLRLVKYDKPVKGVVRVTDYCILTKGWFDQMSELVATNAEKVVQGMDSFGHT